MEDLGSKTGLGRFPGEGNGYPLQISQVKEFSAFLCTRRSKSLGSLKSFLLCAPHLSRASTCFHILSFLSVGLTVGSGCREMAARQKGFSFLSALGAQWLMLVGCNH